MLMDRALPPDSAATWGPADAAVTLIGLTPTSLAEHVQRTRPTAVVVLSRDVSPAASQLAVTIAAGAHPDVRFSLLRRSASALALTAAGSAALAHESTAGLVRRRADHLLQGTLSGVWLERVNRLQSPNPTMVQHARSMLPRPPGFFVVFGDRPAVVPAAPTAPPRTSLLVTADGPSAALAAFTSASGPAATPVTVDAVLSTGTAYGSAGAEFAYLPESVELPVGAALCPVCAEACDGSTCPFCHVTPTLVQETLA